MATLNGTLKVGIRLYLIFLINESKEYYGENIKILRINKGICVWAADQRQIKLRQMGR